MDEWLRKTAERQHGLLCRSQLLERLGEKQLEWWLADRRLQPTWPGVYRVAGAPVSWEQRLHACCLSAGPAVYASHRSAGRLWGLSGVPAVRLEVVAPRARAVRLAGVVAHRSNLLDGRFVSDVEGIPVTTAERAIIDLSAVLGEHTLGRVLDDAARRRIVSYDSVHRCLEQMRRRGRRRTTVVDRLLEPRLGVAAGESDLETRIGRWLAQAGLPQPVPQFWVVAGGRRFRLDLAYPDRLVGFELDGWESHGSRDAFDADRARGNELALDGWRIYRFTARTNRSTVVRVARAALDATSPPTLARRTRS